MISLRLQMKNNPFFPIALFLLIPCYGQSQKSDTAIAPTPPMQQAEKAPLIDTAKTKDTVQAKQAQTSDTLGIAEKTASDTVGKKKDEGLVDTVFYGTEGGFIDYNLEKKIMRLIHSATVRYQNIKLFADTILYHIDESIFEASGKPQLVEGSDTTIGETMIYNIKTKRGRVRYASTHMNDAFFNGRQIVKSEKNELYVDQGDYTTCVNVEAPHYFFYGKNIKLVPEDKIIGRPVVFAIGDAPVAVLPYFIFPIKKNRTSGMLTPIWGGHPESGGYIDNLGYYWAINDYFDLQVSGRIQEFQQYVVNTSTNYCKKYVLNGRFSGRYTLNNNFQKQNKQWAVDFSHNQKITPDGNLSLLGSGSLVSDESFYKNFSEDSTELLNQSMNANMSLSKRFESINASASLTWNESRNLKTGDKTDDLPSLSFSLPSRTLFPFTPKETDGTPDENKEPAWYNNISYSYSAQALQKIFSGRSDTSNYQRGEIAQTFNLSSPLKLFKWITVSPHFDARFYLFDQYTDTSASDSAFVPDTTFDTVTQLTDNTFPVSDTVLSYDPVHSEYDTTYKRVKSVGGHMRPVFTPHKRWTSNYGWSGGASASTDLYGTYPVNLFGFVGIRHTLTPSIGYTFVPKHTLDKKYFDLIGNEGPHDKSQTISLSVGNQFQGKIASPPEKPGEKPMEKKFQILSASFSTGYNFEAKKRKWQDLSVSANTGYSVFRLSYSSTFWLYDSKDALSRPLLQSYSINVSPDALTAHGTLWDGDKIIAGGTYPKDDPSYQNAGPKAWQLSISPSYSFSRSRNSLSEPFASTKNYNLNASASMSFTRKWSVSWNSYYNFVTNQMVGHNLHFGCDLECWNMVFDYQPAGSYNAGYYFKINIKKVPEIFWEKRD